MEKRKAFFKKIQQYHEDKFSREIVIPLLQKMGYVFTDFNGGSYEQGKDIIASRINEFGEQEVTVIQSKMLKTARNSKSSQKFSQITHQLKLCLQQPIACSDGIKRLPYKVLLVTPFPIDTRSLEEQFEAISIHRVTIIDEPKIAALLETHWRDIFDEFFDAIDKVKQLEPNEIQNTELNRALHIEKRGDYAEYYSDLSFFVGKTESSRILASKIVLTKKHSDGYTVDDWMEIKQINERLRSLVGEGIICSDIQTIERSFAEENDRFVSDENRDNIHKHTLAKHKIIDLKGDLAGAGGRLLSYKKHANNEIKKESWIPADLEALLKSIKDNEITAHIAESIKSKILESLETERISGDVVRDLQDVLGICEELINVISNEKILKDKLLPQPRYKVDIDTKKPEVALNEKISKISSTLDMLHAKRSSEIRNILDEVNQFLRCIDYLIKNDKFKPVCIEIVNDKREKSVLNISPHAIFDSGVNIAVYGEAGAGKSTTLHVYAEKIFSGKSIDEAIIFVPLNRVVTKIKDLPVDEVVRLKLINEESPVEAFLNAFFLYKGVSVTKHNRESFIEMIKKSRRTVMIIDALDEAASHASWIIPALTQFANMTDKLQIITSSRSSVSFINDIDFLGITLLPFNEAQLKRFIFGWIGDMKKAEDLWSGLYNKDILDVAKNPLLATIICTLHQRGVKIPDNEPDVYRKNIELLCGLYDQYKGVSRVKNDRAILELFSRKLAFKLHSQERREATIAELKQFIVEDPMLRYEVSIIDSVIDDLITCGVLIYMSDTGRYSLGHLRIQEFLASEEIIHNRSIDIVGLSTRAWWTGAFYLYSFSCDIEQFIEDIVQRYGNFKSHKEILRKMILAQPKSKQTYLTDLVNKHVRLDSLYD